MLEVFVVFFILTGITLVFNVIQNVFLGFFSIANNSKKIEVKGVK